MTPVVVKVKGTFFALIKLHNELIAFYDNNPDVTYKGISIRQEEGEFILEYKLIYHNHYGQSENYKRSEFYNEPQRLSKSGEREIR
jgi:hypothetical protein